LGVAQTLQGDFGNAREALDEAVRLSLGETSTGTTSLAYLVWIDLQEGDEAAAFRHAQRAHAVVERPGMRNYMPSICTYTVVAHLLDRRGDREGAALAVERVDALLPRLTEAYWWQMIMTRILLPPVLVALGRAAEAATRLEEAAALLAVHRDSGKLPDWHAEAVRTLRAGGRRRPEPSQALSDAERRILRLLATDLTLREIGRELYLSMNTVKTHTRSIYRKLGVSSRAEAVKASRSHQPAHGDSPG
jgi:LuxR family maltose regulon positive regulatory protein